MSTERSSAQSPAGEISAAPPSYTPKAFASPIPNDKIAYQAAPLPSDEKTASSKTDAPKTAYEDLPEVVPQEQLDQLKMHPAPPSHAVSPLTTPGHGNAQLNHETSQPWPPPPPSEAPQPTSVPPLQSYTSPPPPVAVSDTVTPLHLLGDQPDTIDCPFCRRRTETNVKKHASSATHIGAAALFFTTFFGVIGPYLCHCCPDIGHYCQNCGRKVAYRAQGTTEMQVFGTPEHLREVSKYPEAKPETKRDKA